MLERYRKDYLGEFVILNTSWKDGKKVQTREWMDNPIKNQHISSRAAIIGPGSSRERFDVRVLEKHKGGLLGRLALQTYAAEHTVDEITPNFLVVFDSELLTKLIENKYTESNVVYTSTKNCLAFPGQFYMVPYNVRVDPLATAIYLAAFDNHREVFLLGLDGLSSKTEHAVEDVIQAYRGVQFYLVNDTENYNKTWKKFSNLRTIGYRDFISHCDI